MGKESPLLQIAQGQHGYFTSRQAVQCGFSRPNFHRKLQSDCDISQSLKSGFLKVAEFYTELQEIEKGAMPLFNFF
jgi:hypothetical protein